MDLAVELNSGEDKPTSETRMGGIERIEVDFDWPIEVVGNVEAVDIATGISFPATSQAFDGTMLVLEFADGLPDEACYLIDLAGIITGLGGDTDCVVRSLVGDTNGDGSANLIDMAQLKSMNGQPVLPDNIRFDVNLDGAINLIDMALVKSLNGNSAGCP
jgi:hypothetical protein